MPRPMRRSGESVFGRGHHQRPGGDGAHDRVRYRAGRSYLLSPRSGICETELSDAISFNKPEDRLSAGSSIHRVFDLRMAALEHQYRIRKSKVRGFVGGRIDLIPHQLYIASEVAGRLAPRVLLADEVGLGKNDRSLPDSASSDSHRPRRASA